MISTVAILLAAAAAPGSAPARDTKTEMMMNVPLFVIMGVLFYFAIIRPQRLRTKELENRVKSLKPGDKILTSGGILGTIVSIKEKSISIRSEDTKLEVLKSAVSEITERKGEPAEAKS